MKETINHIGISGGKDSTALLLWAVHESRYPKESLRVTFCDTGNEHEFTYEYIRFLSERVHPVEWLKPELDFYQLARKKHRFPSVKARFCTTELKIKPSRDYIHDLLREGYEVRLHTGVRAAESADRAKLPEREFDPDFLTETYRPILTWKLADVLAIHDRYGIPPNPLYGLTRTLPWNGEPNPFYGDGITRVGCYPCIMSRKSEIAKIARLTPERVEWLAAQEESIQGPYGYSSFFHRMTVPLAQRSKEITAKSGEVMKIATIRDVARWSKTSRGGVQYTLDFALQEAISDEPPSCASRYGMCE